MKYLKLKCDRYDCRCVTLIEINEWFKEAHPNGLPEYFICPDCEGIIWCDCDDANITTIKGEQ